MAGLITNCKPFFGDLCDEMRLFIVEKKIEEAQEAKEGLFIRVFLHENGGVWDADCEVLLDGKTICSFQSSVPAEAGSALYVKKMKKRFIKNALYSLLKGYTGTKPPWGSLTGIRPTKLARELLAEMGGKAKEFFQAEFDVDGHKATLAFDIAQNQLPLIKDITANDLDIYVGIPFCVSRCSYCSFGSHELKKSRKITGQYLDALAREIEGAKRLAEGRNVRCIYVGGGTPTALDAEELQTLFGVLKSAFPHCKEFTVEAGRPDTMDAKKLAAIKESGATRVCVNAQTTNGDTLQRIGRTYGAGEFDSAFRLAREHGFDFVNTDIILGLPGETLKDVQKTLEDVCGFDPENVTVHTLAIKNAANLTLDDSAKFADAAAVAKMVDFSREFLEGRGYIPYYLYRQKYMAGNLENVGYAKPGKLCLYNIDIMEELADNLSFGAGAMSKRIFAAEKRIERSCNIKEVNLYMERVDEMVQRKIELFK